MYHHVSNALLAARIAGVFDFKGNVLRILGLVIRFIMIEVVMVFVFILVALGVESLNMERSRWNLLSNMIVFFLLIQQCLHLNMRHLQRSSALVVGFRKLLVLT